MKLLLTSEGFSNRTIQSALVELAEKPVSELKLAFIPTAATGEKGNKIWLLDLFRCEKMGFKSIDVIDISELSKDEWFPRMKDANVFMFGGGDTLHLMHWLEKSGLKTLLPNLLKTRIYVGISAGSIVCSDNILPNQLKRLYGDGDSNVSQTVNGLGFVKFQFRPHLNSLIFPKVREELLKEIAKERPEKVFVLDDQSALQVRDKTITVVSEGKWIEYN